MRPWQIHKASPALQMSITLQVARPTLQKALHHRPAILQGKRQDANGRADGVPSSHPVPEAEGVLGVDAKLFDQLGIGADRDHVLGHRVWAKLRHQPCPAFGNGQSQWISLSKNTGHGKVALVASWAIATRQHLVPFPALQIRLPSDFVSTCSQIP